MTVVSAWSDTVGANAKDTHDIRLCLPLATQTAADRMHEASIRHTLNIRLRKYADGYRNGRI